MSSELTDILDLFHPAVRAWFAEKFVKPTPPQLLGWPLIAQNKNTLVLAPTGSGKTLAAFLVCLDQILKLKTESAPGLRGAHTLYISPLKALNYDIERNLEEPLQGILESSKRLGLKLPDITTAVRTGDTPQRERERLLKSPPDILITTPESLHLMLTSIRARKILATIQYVIIDEIHALSDNKRGVFLSLLLERLAHLTNRSFVRIGLSATQRPLDEIARFLGGFQVLNENGRTIYQNRPVEIVNTGMRKELDVQIICPVEDMRNLPEKSIWPCIYQQLLNLIHRHKSTLIFANSRRTVERITSEINDLAGMELCRAHHGSVSRELRHQLEQALKQGELPALVATGSLELGIDMGAIDLVVQVESPRDIARALQRIGRAGHLYGAASKGRMLPKTRSDLLEMAVITQAMKQGNIAPIRIPQNCLDVLAQQVVAMVAMEPWPVNALYDWVRQVYSYANLPRSLFIQVLEMLSGRYPLESYRDLRPRISWDRIHDVLYPLPGSQRLAIINGGVIPDTGQFGAYLADGLVKLGELEEEFIYETRLGDVIQLGTGKWRVLEILQDRILLQPANNVPARMPFWKGEFFTRSPHLGEQIAQSLQEMDSRLENDALIPWLMSEFNLDQDSANNLSDYLLAQKQAAGALPDKRSLLIEGFFDEIGDIRVAILSPWGGRVHLPWRLAIISQFRQVWGAEPESYHSDVGLLFRMPAESFEDMVRIIQSVTADNLESLVIEELSSSAFFGLRFRQNAHRALLLPSNPSKRMPLWLQRMKARDLLEIARKLENFPILVETFRECMQDLMALDQLRQLLRQIETGEIRFHIYRRQGPSPFVASLLFEFQAAYQYEYEIPKTGGAARPNIQLSLLDELLRPERARALFDDQAIQDMQQRLSGRAIGYQARTPIELIELLRRQGDLNPSELQAAFTGDINEAISWLIAENQITLFAFGAESRYIPTEELTLFTTAFQSTDAAARAAQDKIFQRYLQNHPVTTAAEISTRYGIDPDTLQGLLQEIGTRPDFVTFEKDNVTHWAYRDNLERLRRTILTRNRREVAAIPTHFYQNFLLAWQHRHPETRLAGQSAITMVVEQLQGLFLPVEIWDSEILGRRIIEYHPNWLEDLISHGELIWAGSGAGSSESRRIALMFPEDLALLFQPAAQPDDDTGREDAAAIRTVLQERGASFLLDVALATHLKPSVCAHTLWRMIWTGKVTNDSFRVLRAGRPPTVPADLATSAGEHQARAGFRRVRTLHRGPRSASIAGRWSLLPQRPVEESPETLETFSWQFLNRYGVICREILQLETTSPAWSALYQVLTRLEWRGDIRRGYFIEGFSGAQFALPAAVERLMHQRTQTMGDDFILINACDPANLYGAASPLPVLHPIEPSWRFLRHSNNYLILHNGRPVIAIEARGQRLTLLRETGKENLARALAQLPELFYDPAGLRRIKSIRVEAWNNTPVLSSEIAPLLSALGFQNEMSSMVLVRKMI